MCGLAGTLLGQNLSLEQLRQVKEVFTENLLANEERGGKATGVVVCHENGATYSLKEPMPAQEFVKLPVFLDFLKTYVTDQARILLGHTREPTKGGVSDHNNNHPIIIGDIVGVHNGIITNDDAIFLNLSQKDDDHRRVGSVDSEAIFALFEEVDGNLDIERYVAGISARVQLLLGSFTTLFFNKKKPTQLFCLRYNNPISCHFDQGMQSLFFSSRYIFLRKTFGRNVISEPMSGQTGFVFDVNGLQVREKVPFKTFSLREENIHNA